MCTSAASQLCCLAAVVGLPTFCCGFCRCRAPLRSSRQNLCWNSCASFGSLSCTSAAADSSWFPPRHPELDHQLRPHEISTRRSTLPKSALKTLTPCFHVVAKNGIGLPTPPVVDERTMLQATWREQAHRARTPLRLTCFAAALTGPRGPSLVISCSAGHGTRVMSRRNVSAHHLRQFAPHSNNSVK